jgi:hypothetical protein
MNQSSPSNTGSEHPRPWLEKYYQARRQRTIDLVKATVDRLLKEGKIVTLEAICTLSREMDSAGKGIKKAGVLGNAEAHAYYRKHSTTYQRGLGYQRRKGRNKHLSTQPSRIDADRDVDRVRQRYLLQPKADLAERLLSVEQTYATCQQQLASLQFELLDLQQQLEDAKRNAQQQTQKEGRARVHE